MEKVYYKVKCFYHGIEYSVKCNTIEEMGFIPFRNVSYVNVKRNILLVEFFIVGQEPMSFHASDESLFEILHYYNNYAL